MNRIIATLGCAVLALATHAGAQGADNPCNPCNGKAAGASSRDNTSGAVNPCHAKHGTVFHVADPMRRNTVTFTSRAPLEDIVGTSNAITGYLVFDPRNPDQGVRGALRVPVKSLDTGIPLRDRHLQGRQWLDANAHPDITFLAGETSSVRKVKEGDGFQTYDVTVTGSLTVHGVARRTTVKARLVYLQESKQTRQKMAGNLLAARATLEVPLAAHKVTGFEGVIGSKVDAKIQVDVSLFATDSSPNSAGNPCNPRDGKAANPCNPCGGAKDEKPREGRAGNPCNPCGGK